MTTAAPAQILGRLVWTELMTTDPSGVQHGASAAAQEATLRSAFPGGSSMGSS